MEEDDEEYVIEDKTAEQIVRECHELLRKTKTYSEKNKRFMNKVGEMVKELSSTMRVYLTVLESVKKTNETVDETLCNVLLAIRQNEYLQAWYPAQGKEPEKKVVGKYTRLA